MLRSIQSSWQPSRPLSVSSPTRDVSKNATSVVSSARDPKDTAPAKENDQNNRTVLSPVQAGTGGHGTGSGNCQDKPGSVAIGVCSSRTTADALRVSSSSNNDVHSKPFLQITRGRNPSSQEEEKKPQPQAQPPTPPSANEYDLFLSPPSPQRGLEGGGFALKSPAKVGTVTPAGICTVVEQPT